MSSTDESENLPDHLTKRINANGWRVISNSAQRPEPEAIELKTLIQKNARASRRTRQAQERRS
jgi:hypothetical protein